MAARSGHRESFGHWEGGLLVFARQGGNANETTLLERRSRVLALLANPNRRLAGVAERIGAALGGLDASLRGTAAFGRGFGFMGHHALDRSLGTTGHFCDPRGPWQKGAVENANGRLRRHLPSNAPAKRLAASSLDALAGRLNATPRRCLGYRAPAEVLDGHPGKGPAEAGLTVAVSHQRRRQ